MDPANSDSKETVVRSSPVSDLAKSATKETIVLSVDSDGSTKETPGSSAGAAEAARDRQTEQRESVP